MTAIRQVLAASSGVELAGKVEELLLATTDAVIEQVGDGSAALALARQRRFELIVTEHPLPDLDLRFFLERLRDSASPSSESAVVVATGSLDRRQLKALGPGLLAGVDLCVNGRQVLKAVARSLRLSDRHTARLRVTFEGLTESFCGRQLARTHNISPTGMLLGAEHLLPVGMVTPISIELSHKEPLIHGSAAVVRHTDPHKEPVVGMAMQFVSFYADGGERLTDYLYETGPGLRARAAAVDG